MATPPILRCGPSGWEHPHWINVVYPRPRPRNFHSLEFLSSLFDLVEIGSSFQDMPKPEISRLWLKKIAANPNFTFTAKLHRTFTHERQLDEGQMKTFKEGLKPLLREGRLGALLMQFPWSFRYTQENRDFVIKLRRAFHEFPLVAEMRHASWMQDEALGTLIDYKVGFCNIDQPQYTKAMPPTAFLTSSIGFVRLHGRNCFNWYQEYPDGGKPASRYDYLYSTSELQEWVQRITNVRKYAGTMYVVTNNDAGGKAVVNGLQLQAMLNGVKPDIPTDLLRRFPKELGDLNTRRPAQSALFTEYRPSIVRANVA
jgi:uncharacterized protein YecE (DUF72 family)